MSGIKEIIKSYIQVDDEIKQISKQLKPLKNNKELLGAQIQEYLLSNSENPNSVLEVGKEIFKIVNTKSKSISKKNLEEVVKKNTNEVLAQTILEELTEEKESNRLKRFTKK